MASGKRPLCSVFWAVKWGWAIFLMVSTLGQKGMRAKFLVLVLSVKGSREARSFLESTCFPHPPLCVFLSPSSSFFLSFFIDGRKPPTGQGETGLSLALTR